MGELGLGEGAGILILFEDEFPGVVGGECLRKRCLEMREEREMEGQRPMAEMKLLLFAATCCHCHCLLFTDA